MWSTWGLTGGGVLTAGAAHLLHAQHIAPHRPNRAPEPERKRSTTPHNVIGKPERGIANVIET